MAAVTRFGYPLNNNLIKKLDLMVERVSSKGSKHDLVFLFEGSEGEGKTTYSIAVAYYFSEKTGRPFNSKHVFFDIDRMIDFAQSTERQIMIWDEPALQALTTDWGSKAVKDLTRLLMMARKKQHIILINMTKFYKFNDYVAVDRPMGMIHVYSRRNIENGRFVYISKRKLEPLWRDYKFAKKRNYGKYSSKSIRGTFPDVLSPDYKNNVLSEFDVVDYEKRKDEAIASIGKTEEKSKKAIELYQLKYSIATELCETLGLQLKQVGEALGTNGATLSKWKDNYEKYGKWGKT